MMKITMLALVLVAVALSGAVSVASAETVPSPLQQVRDGVPIGEVMCSEDRVLMASPSGRPACVFEESVLELNTRWMATDTMKNDNILLPYDSEPKNTEIQNPTNKPATGDMNNVDMGEVLINIPTNNNSITYDAELISILEKDLIFTNTNQEADPNTLSELGGFGLPEKWPIYNVTYPRTAQVGVPFDVVYNYSFTIPDEETGSYVDFNDQCSEDGCGRMLFTAKVSSYVNVTSDNLEYDRDLVGGKTVPMTNRTVYEYHPEFDNTQSLEETFTFVINEPNIDYRIGVMQVQIQSSHNDDVVYFYVGEDGNIIFDPMMKEETFEQSSLARSDATSAIKAASVIRTEFNKLQERPWTPTTIVYPPVGLRDGPPPELYEIFAEKLLRQYPDEENFEEFLIYYNYTQTWIDGFLNAMPHLKPDDSLTSQAMDFLTSYMLLPQAYATEATTIVFGQLVNTDEDGSRGFVHGGTVCAYDVGSSGLDPIIVNNEHVCSVTAQSGTFVLEVPTIDPSGSGNTDVALKAFAKNSYFEFFLNYNRDQVIINDNTQFDDIPAMSHNVGFFDISERIYLDVPIEHQHFWALDRLTDIQEWYTDNVVGNTKKVYVVYDPNECRSGAFYDPVTFIMELSHTEAEDGEDCTLRLHGNVYSPLTNQDTLAHEYGHAIFYHTYDDYDSDYPVYYLTDPSGYHSPVHSNNDEVAWVEGWAFFMALAYSESPIYQPSYMEGQWNFETRNHNEINDSRFAGKSFVTGNSGEGNVAAALWDAFDTVNESGDDQQDLLDEIWDSMGDFVEADETVTATDIAQYKDDWDDDGHPNIERIFTHNTLVYATPPPPPNDRIFFIEDFEDGFTEWTLTNGNPGLTKQWEIEVPRTQIPDYPATNMAAVTGNDCDLSCIMTLETAIDLSSLTDAKLLIDRWVDRSLDPDQIPKEGLKVEISSDGGATWETAYEWTSDAGDDIDEWFLGDNDSDVYNIPTSKLTSDFKIKILGTSSTTSERIYVDNVKITTSVTIDTVSPTITLLPPTNMTIQGNTPYVDPGYSAIDDIDGDITSRVVVLGSVDVTTVGTYTLTYTVSDSARNSAVEKIRTVNVVDTIPPVITPPANIEFEATGILTPVNIRTPDVMDNVDPNPTIIRNPTTTSFQVGVTVITWTATDSSNNSNTMTQTITVQDTTSPAITVPADASFTTTGTFIALNASNYGTATATDLVDPSPVITSNAPTSFRADETTTITWTATDNSGNRATATQAVTVTSIPADTLSPRVSSITRSDPSNSVTNSQTLVFNATFSEAVTGVGIADFEMSSGSPPASSTQMRTPSLAIPDEQTVQDAMTMSGQGTISSVSVSVNITHAWIGDLKVELVSPSGIARVLHGNTGSSNDNIVETYEPDFAGVPISGSWILRITDILAPDSGTLNNWSLTLNSNPVTGVSGTGDSRLVTVSASQSGTYNLDVVSGGIFDLAGNPLSNTAPTGADESYVVTVASSDTTSPSITAPANVTAEATGLLTTASIGTATVSDNVDPNPAVSNDAPTAFPPGPTTVTWTATDSSGNTATATQLITMQDTTSPSITAPPDVTAEATASSTPASIGTATVSDNVDQNPTIYSGAPQAFPLGNTTVTWIAIDSSGNIATATQLITIQDTTPPSITAPADIDVTFAPSVSTVVIFNTPVATDLADIVVDVSCTPVSGSEFTAGDTAVTCTATDDSGNLATTSFTVSVTVNTVHRFPPQVNYAKATDSEVVLAWFAPARETATSYQILRGTGSDMSVLVNDTQSTGTLYIDNSVSPGTFYTYQVRAMTANGLSPPSSPVNATTSPAGTLDLLATSSNGSVTLTWNGVDGAVGYRLQQTQEIDSEIVVRAWFLGSNTLTVTDSSVSEGDTPVYHIYANVNRAYPDYNHYDFVRVTVE